MGEVYKSTQPPIDLPDGHQSIDTIRHGAAPIGTLATGALYGRRLVNKRSRELSVFLTEPERFARGLRKQTPRAQSEAERGMLFSKKTKRATGTGAGTSLSKQRLRR